MFKGRSTPHWLSVCLCFSLVAVSSPLSAQSPQEPEPEPIPSLTIRVSSRLVLVDVVVTDKHGQPVLGLQPTDFTVTEKGKPQKISVFTPPNSTPAQPAAPRCHRANIQIAPSIARPAVRPPLFSSTPPILPFPTRLTRARRC